MKEWESRYFGANGKSGASLKGTGERRLDRIAVKQYLGIRAVFEPRTLLKGVSKLTRCHCRPVKPVMPDILLEQKPEGKFGVLLSGGVDSNILAKLYDGPETEFVFIQTPLGQERKYFDNIAGTLKGRTHVVDLTEELYYQYCKEIYDAIDNPVGDGAIVAVYAGAKKFAELGVKTMVVGEGGDEGFGGYWAYEKFSQMDAGKLAYDQATVLGHFGVAFEFYPEELMCYWQIDGFMDELRNYRESYLMTAMKWDRNKGLYANFLWKNITGAKLAGVNCLVPYAHPYIWWWAQRNLKRDEMVDPGSREVLKVYLKKLAISLGVPEENVYRVKMGFRSEATKATLALMRKDLDRGESFTQIYSLWSLQRWCDTMGMREEYERCLRSVFGS